MKKTNKKNKNVVIILLLILLLALAVGYAAFSDILTISGTANAKGTFDLEFQHAEVVTAVGVNKENTTAQISEDKNTLQVNVADLSYPGAGVEFSVDIVNVGTIPAMVNAVTPTNITGSEHIKIEGLEAITTDHPIIEAGGKCNIHFTVEWPVTATDPLGENGESTSFELEIEYTQGTGKEFEGTPKHDDGIGESNTPVIPTISEKLTEIIQPSDYGKTINYSATVKGEKVNNWKVFYNDGQNVYIILDNYLENRLLPEETGLQTSGTYNIYSNQNRDTLISGLITENYWREFAGGVEGATASGSPTADLLIDSYNKKNGTTLKYKNMPILDITDALYTPNTSVVDNCVGYWTTSIYDNDMSNVWHIGYNGTIYTGNSEYNNVYLAIRPIVKLPSQLTGAVGEIVEISK